MPFLELGFAVVRAAVAVWVCIGRLYGPVVCMLSYSDNIFVRLKVRIRRLWHGRSSATTDQSVAGVCRRVTAEAASRQ